MLQLYNQGANFAETYETCQKFQRIGAAIQAKLQEQKELGREGKLCLAQTTD